MADPSLQKLYTHVRGLALGQNGEGPSDRELLDRYLAARDEAAFAALVHRHGAMVLATCRRLLPGEQDAEDAWQATFLVLACRGKSIRQGPSLAGWLHGVACRIGRKLRASLMKRQCRTEIPDLPDRATPPDVGWREVQAILDEELQRLPENYRAPIVLCYLEGLTRDEAARQLGWTFDILRGRLDRARQRLRNQLIRRGVTLSGSLLGVALAEPIRASEVPATLAVAALRSASQAAGGVPLRSMVSARVAALMEGVLATMFWTKGKIAALVLLMTCIAGISAGLLAQAPGNFDLFQKGGEPSGKKSGGMPDLARRVEELEKQVAWLMHEVKTLRGSGGVPAAKANTLVEESVSMRLVAVRDMVKTIEKVLGKRENFSLDVNEKTNTLTIRGRAEDVEQALTMLRKTAPSEFKSADESKTAQLVTIPLKFVNAVEAAKIIKETMDDRKGLKVVVEQSTNAIIVSGSVEDITMIRKIVEKIDIGVDKAPARNEKAVLKTFLTRNVKAADAAKVIEKVFQDPDVRVTAAGEKTVVVFAPPKVMEQIEALIGKLDQAIEEEQAIKEKELQLGIERERQKELDRIKRPGK